jgi:hypothetical protein
MPHKPAPSSYNYEDLDYNTTQWWHEGYDAIMLLDKYAMGYHDFKPRHQQFSSVSRITGIKEKYLYDAWNHHFNHPKDTKHEGQANPFYYERKKPEAGGEGPRVKGDVIGSTNEKRGLIMYRSVSTGKFVKKPDDFDK